MFSKKSAPPARIAAKPMATGNGTFSVIGSDVTITLDVQAALAGE